MRCISYLAVVAMMMVSCGGGRSENDPKKVAVDYFTAYIKGDSKTMKRLSTEDIEYKIELMKEEHESTKAFSKAIKYDFKNVEAKDYFTSTDEKKEYLVSIPAYFGNDTMNIQKHVIVILVKGKWLVNYFD